MSSTPGNSKRDVYDYDIRSLPDSGPAKMTSLVGRNKTVLEVGCGPGSQSRVFRDLGCRVVGLEIDPNRAEAARAFCEQVHVVNVETAQLYDLLGDAKFDVITCADVLEHLHDPAATVRRLAPFLKCGGYMLASIPNVTHASVVFEMAHGRFEYREFGLLDDTHIRFFCRRTALAVLESAGFAVSEIHCVNRSPHDTELRPALVGGEDSALMNMILGRNPDSLTYQFVLKAYPAIGTDGASTHLHGIGEQLRQLEQTIKDQQREILRLSSIVTWFETRPLLRAYRRLQASLRR